MLTSEPRSDWSDNCCPERVIGNDFLCPSKRLEKSSRTSMSPRVHAEKESVLISRTSTWNSLKSEDAVVGIPVEPPVGIVKMSPNP